MLSSNGFDTTLRRYDTDSIEISSASSQFAFPAVTVEAIQTHNIQLAESLEKCLQEIDLLKLEIHTKNMRIEELEGMNADIATADLSCFDIASDKQLTPPDDLTQERGVEAFIDPSFKSIPPELVPDFLGFSLQEFLDEN